MDRSKDKLMAKKRGKPDVMGVVDRLLAGGATQQVAISGAAHELRMSYNQVLREVVGWGKKRKRVDDAALSHS